MEVSPYERWYDRKPSSAHLRVFGCDAWVNVSGVISGTRKLTFVGYSALGDRFVDLASDLATGKITVGREAKFLELEEAQRQEEKAEESDVELVPLKDSGKDKQKCIEEPKNESDLNDPVDNDGNHSEHEQFFDLNSYFSGDPLAVQEEIQDSEVSESEPRRNRGQLPERYSDFVVGLVTHEKKPVLTGKRAKKCSGGSSKAKG